MTFLNSILNNSKEHEDPFKHWELNEPLSNEAIQEIIKADIPNVTDHNLNYDGTRAIDGGAPEFREGIASGGKAIKFRCFITKDNAKKFPALLKLIKEPTENERKILIEEVRSQKLKSRNLSYKIVTVIFLVCFFTNFSILFLGNSFLLFFCLSHCWTIPIWILKQPCCLSIVQYAEPHLAF